MNETNAKEYGFMDVKGDLKIISFTDKQVSLGELRGHIEQMKEEGYTFLGIDSNVS